MGAARKALVDDVPSLPVALWVREARSNGGSAAGWHTCPEGVFVGYKLSHEDSTLVVEVHGRQPPVTALLEFQPLPRRGGERVVVVCPRCMARTRRLYLHPSSYAVGCRSCHQLAYSSQLKPRYQRRAEQAFALADPYGGGYLGEPFPPRPVGKWRIKHERLRDEQEALIAEAVRLLGKDERWGRLGLRFLVDELGDLYLRLRGELDRRLRAEDIESAGEIDTTIGPLMKRAGNVLTLRAELRLLVEGPSAFRS